jgi:hypothetical protein
MLQAAVVSTDPVFDLDCDGAASLADLSRTLTDAGYSLQPGPSAYACAGQIPCP